MNPYKRGKVYPSPPPRTPDHCLSVLPVTLLSLAVALSSDDQQVLAYLISCCANAYGSDKAIANEEDQGTHSPHFGCDCFRCYTTYWVRWDNSPNHQVIHQIIEAYEENQMTALKNRRRKRKGLRKRINCGQANDELVPETLKIEASEIGIENENPDSPSVDDFRGNDVESQDNVDEKGSVRKFASLIGEKVWGFWRGY